MHLLDDGESLMTCAFVQAHGQDRQTDGFAKTISRSACLACWHAIKKNENSLTSNVKVQKAESQNIFDSTGGEGHTFCQILSDKSVPIRKMLKWNVYLKCSVFYVLNHKVVMLWILQNSDQGYTKYKQKYAINVSVYIVRNFKSFICKVGFFLF